MNLFNKKPVFHIKTDFAIEHVFDYLGDAYFRVKDPHQLPAGRAFAVKKYYDQLKSSCSFDYLKAFHLALKNIYDNQQQIKISKIIELNQHLGERLEFLYSDDDVLRFASVIYFTNSESPFKYDQAYNQQKVEKWKKAPDIYDFFLSEPIVTLLPYLAQLGTFIPIYSNVVHEVSKLQIQALLSTLSTEQRAQPFAQNLQSSEDLPQSMNTSSENPSSSISESSMKNLRNSNRKNIDKYKRK